MFQQIMLLGNLGNDPEMRYTPSGVPVANFSLAVSRVYNDANGQRQEKTTWFRVTAWRREAELVSQYLTKGRQVLVVGEVEEARPFMGNDGQPRATLEVTARTIRFVGSRGDSSGDTGSYQSSAGAGQRSSANNNNYSGDTELTDEDIPF